MEATSSSSSSEIDMQIFKAIGEIVTDPEFNTARQNFYDMHSKTFDDNVDENKHEYKQIYEEYLKITENVIEAKIKENYGHDEEAFKSFLMSFPDKKSVYEAENEDTVELLFGMTDFQEFKRKAIEAKKGMVDKENTKEEDDSNTAYMKLQIEDEWGNFQTMLNEDLTAKSPGWKKKVDMKEFKNGYKATVYQRKQPGRKVDLIRVDAEFQNIEVADMLDFWKNPPAEMSGIKECKTLEELADGSRIQYWRFAMPMMTDRDNVFHCIEQKRAEGTYFTMQTVEHASMPPVKGVIRMFYYLSAFFVQKGDNVTMQDLEHYDMKGYLPASLMNMAIASETAKQFTAMMKHIYAKKKQ